MRYSSLTKTTENSTTSCCWSDRRRPWLCIYQTQNLLYLRNFHLLERYLKCMLVACNGWSWLGRVFFIRFDAVQFNSFFVEELVARTPAQINHKNVLLLQHQSCASVRCFSCTKTTFSGRKKINRSTITWPKNAERSSERTHKPLLLNNRWRRTGLV